jgi:glycosyltransferase involved in cell wall biosynthesis
LLRYLFFVGTLRSELRKGDQVYATDVFSVGIPMRLALIGQKNRFTVRLGGEWCWEDAVNHRERVTLREFWSQPETIKRKLMRWNYRWILNRAERIYVTSELLREVLIEKIVPACKDKIVTHPNTTAVRPGIPDAPRGTGILHLIYIGRFAPVKNVPFLARVLRKLVEKGVAFEMEFVGSGSEETLVRQALGGMEGVRFFGSLPHEKAMKRLTMSDALLLPSLSDMNPNSAIEALALGKPCFITQEHGLAPHPLLHELDPKDEDAWVEAITAFIKRRH